MCVILSGRTSNNEDYQHLTDKEAILCSLNIKAMKFAINDLNPNATIVTKNYPQGENHPKNTSKKSITMGHNIPIITELVSDANVQFLDQDDDDDPSTELYMTQPFACGTAFAVSVLDSLMSTTYFNGSSLSLLRSLITGGSTSQLEKILAEGEGMTLSQFSTINTLNARDRCKFIMISVDSAYFEGVKEYIYQNILLVLLRNYGILSIGMYRLLDFNSLEYDYIPKKRFVICNPPLNMPIYLHDKLFCLMPFDSSQDDVINSFKNYSNEIDTSNTYYHENSDNDTKSDVHRKSADREISTHVLLSKHKK
ncbi:hypothetical protein A3Q56_04873 [Intoshia linei]|uniref:Calcium-activated potassium channel BK alpha subunit domain-containing protein n=1 Tax=Intoshia linei TaxID=1819745 RepID=A0A177B0Z4_9BILA|nr:hypothetical protein A3Q56_04873 [Intoshia linei]